MASGIYRIGKDALESGTNITSAVLRAMLVNASHTFTYDNDYVSDISANELTGYTRVTLANVTVTEVAGSNTVKIDFDDPTFSSVGTGQTAEAVVVYIQIGGDDTTPADDILLFSLDFTAPLPTNGGDITANVNAAGAATN